MKLILPVLFCCLIFCAACRNDREQVTRKAEAPESAPATVPFQGCRTCHPADLHDQQHDLPCVACHQGNAQGREKETAHDGLVAKPAHPDFMAQSCGGCHPDQVEKCRSSLHFTLGSKINTVREHFGATDKLTSLTELVSSARPATTLELVDDMLRRRCLRCHVYSSGDTYASTQRGTGCAACHMGFANGKLTSHQMIGRPRDFQCLGCHYANFVGADYYGRYEHDFGSEYRTPFTTREDFFRPYGVEYHELAPDIHQQRGISCIDCHTGHQKISPGLTCRTCHRKDSGSPADPLPSNLHVENGRMVLTARLTGNKHPVPAMTSPVHEIYGEKVSCQVCHAQWSYNDTTTHLLRNDTDDFDPWSRLLVQSSSSVENLLFRNLYSDEEELPPAMPDTVTGRPFPGVWYKGFTERRWERMLVREDLDGRIKVFRPILDLRLSYVDSNDQLVFDNIEGSGRVLLPYTPHTTGKAGLFYLNRFAHLIKKDKQTDAGK